MMRSGPASTRGSARWRPPSAASSSTWAEFDRRQAFRDEGATSAQAWAVERYGVSTATARALTRVRREGVGPPAPHRVVCAPATSPSTRYGRSPTWQRPGRRAAAGPGPERSVRELADVARTTAATVDSSCHVRLGTRPRLRARRSLLRFNDEVRTMTVQLPADAYAETRTCLEARARNVPTDGETPWDQRLCDALIELIRSSASPRAGPRHLINPYFVVVHVPLDALVDDAVEATELAGELERGGLIDCETVQRIACDATFAVAVDDDVGHTMYEGRARRFTDRCPASGGDAARPPLSVSRMHQRDLHECASRRSVGTGRPDRPRQPRAHVPASPSCGAQRRLDACPGTPTRSCVRRPDGGVMVSRPSLLWTRARSARLRITRFLGRSAE